MCGERQKNWRTESETLRERKRWNRECVHVRYHRKRVSPGTSICDANHLALLNHTLGVRHSRDSLHCRKLCSLLKVLQIRSLKTYWGPWIVSLLCLVWQRAKNALRKTKMWQKHAFMQELPTGRHAQNVNAQRNIKQLYVGDIFYLEISVYDMVHRLLIR